MRIFFASRPVKAFLIDNIARQRVYIGTDPSIDPAEPDPLQPLHSPAAPSPSVLTPKCFTL